MKKKKRNMIALLASVSFVAAHAQDSVNASGSDASGSGGTVAYSVGQVACTYSTGTNGNSGEGVQQPYEIFSVGISENTQSISLNAYPNPTNNELHLQVKDGIAQNANIVILDAEGRILMEKKIISSDTELDLSSFASGTYLLRVTSDNKQLSSFRIIKK